MYLNVMTNRAVYSLNITDILTPTLCDSTITYYYDQLLFSHTIYSSDVTNALRDFFFFFFFTINFELLMIWVWIYIF